MPRSVDMDVDMCGQIQDTRGLRGNTDWPSLSTLVRTPGRGPDSAAVCPGPALHLTGSPGTSVHPPDFPVLIFEMGDIFACLSHRVVMKTKCICGCLWYLSG